MLATLGLFNYFDLPDRVLHATRENALGKSNIRWMGAKRSPTFVSARAKIQINTPIQIEARTNHARQANTNKQRATDNIKHIGIDIGAYLGNYMGH